MHMSFANASTGFCMAGDIRKMALAHQSCRRISFCILQWDAQVLRICARQH